MAAKAKKVAGRALRGWAACLGRILGVDDIKCPRCGGALLAVAAIQDDVELARLMEHLSLESDFPKTKPARAPPSGVSGEESAAGPPCAAQPWPAVAVVIADPAAYAGCKR